MKIRHEVEHLFDALEKQDEKASLAAAKVLVTQALVDLNRIADALQTLASPPPVDGTAGAAKAD